MEKITEQIAEEILRAVMHPSEGRDIVSLGMVSDLKVSEDGRCSLKLNMLRPGDPVASSLARAVKSVLMEASGKDPDVTIVEPKPKSNPQKDAKQKMLDGSLISNVKHIIAVASGKGGVGKSSVTVGLALALDKLGYKVGILDADIYGPSIPKMMGLEGYMPLMSSDEKHIIPASHYGVEVMSIGFFIGDADALIWRGPMATNALNQMIHETLWSELDYLLIDLPPGTGDVHLSVVGELNVEKAVIVTTPQLVALADVVRGISMFRNKNINIPIVGIVENMSYFQPEDGKRYYIFGHGTEKVASEVGLDIVASIPISPAISDGGDNGDPAVLRDESIMDAYLKLASAISK